MYNSHHLDIELVVLSYNFVWMLLNCLKRENLWMEDVTFLLTTQVNIAFNKEKKITQVICRHTRA